MVSALPAEGQAVHVPGAPLGRSLGDDQRLDLLSAAWHTRDVEALAALAEVDDRSRMAALVLAGAAGRVAGDPRAEHWLYRAFLTGEELTTNELLAPHVGDISFPVLLRAWGVNVTFPASREALGMSVAAEELNSGDADSAYGILLDLPTSPAVAALRGAVALDLQWWPRAARAVRSADLGPWQALGACVSAGALAHTQAWADAVTELDAALLALEEPDTIGGSTLRGRCQFARAEARRQLGDVDGAWADLTALVAAAPSYPGALEALKSL